MNSYFFFTCLILVTVVLNTAAQTLLKLGTEYNMINIYLLSGILTYGMSTLVYLLALSRLNLSLIYPVVIGLSIVATTFSSTVFFERTSSYCPLGGNWINYKWYFCHFFS